jgi:hypothetical protein
MYRIRVLSFAVIAIFLLGVATIVATPASGGATPDGCLTSAYTLDIAGSHYSYVKTDSVLIGYDIFVESNCGDFQLKANNITLGGGSRSVFFSLPEGTNSIQIQFENSSVEYTNLTIFPAGEVWYGEFNNPDEITVASSSIWWNEIVSHVVTFLIVFFLSTTVVHKIAQYKVDREFEVLI